MRAVVTGRSSRRHPDADRAASGVPGAAIDGDLFAAAKSSGALHNRSAAQQIAHWARIGRWFEASTGVSHRDVEAVLAGDGSYDALHVREQAIVRTRWDEQVAEGLSSLDLEKGFQAAGVEWVEADDDGRLVARGPAAS